VSVEKKPRWRGWPWLLLGGVAIGGAAAAFLSASVAPPFGFLEGFRRVNYRLSPEDKEIMRLGKFEVGIYTARTSFNDVVNKAEKELVGLGFQGRGKRSDRMYFDREPKGGPHPGASSLPESIVIEDGFKGTDGMGTEAFRADTKSNPGWVTVGIAIRREEATWERIKSWFGL
jgi:hypothetical protein